MQQIRIRLALSILPQLPLVLPFQARMLTLTGECFLLKTFPNALNIVFVLILEERILLRHEFLKIPK